MRYDEMYEGMDVYDSNDQKIGTVQQILDATGGSTSRSGGGYLRVPTGFLGMGTEHHIPFSAVRSIEGDGIYVSFAKERLDELGYGEAPTYLDEPVHSAQSGETVGTATQRMRLREEELVARKQSIEKGRVRLEKEVVKQQQTMDVPVTREEVTIERHPVERRPSDKPIEETGRTLEVPVREERVEVEKRPVVYEEVGVGKREVTETQPVSATVRREEARIERTGDVSVRGWETEMPRYRERWQRRFGASGDRWEDAEPAYRYGFDLSSRPEYRGQRWDQLEPSVRSDWERRYPNTPWDRARERVREAWEETTA